jgi:RsiW-degrading membrane proteinase PrsW (M82 family)
MAPVDPRAIIEGRVPGRAPIGLIMGMAICSACLIGALVLIALNGASFGVGVGLALLPVPLLISLVLMLDRLEPEPWRALSFAFMWGAGVAVLGALILNTVGLEYVTAPIFGAARGQLVSATIGAPIIEESLKGSVLFGILWWRRDELDSLTDGIVYAAMVAIGFAMMENITYYMRAAAGHDLESVFILRGVLTPLGHPLFTSMTGLGVAYGALHRGHARVVAPILGLASAMILHGSWNFATEFGPRGVAIDYGIDACILIVLLVIMVRDRMNTVRLIHDHLPEYVPAGIVTRQDITMLGSIPLRRQARRWARWVGGSRARHAMADYQLAATELALAHQRVDRGVAAPDWFVPRRDALLHLMQLARQTFQAGGTRPDAPWGASGFLQSTRLHERPG